MPSSPALFRSAPEVRLTTAFRVSEPVSSHRPQLPLLPITTDAGILAVLSGVCALFFWLEKATRWRLFQVLPPLVFIYLVPVILSNTGVIPAESPVYKKIGELVLPMMLVLMLLNVDVVRAIALAGRGVGVMLFGAAGVVVGAVLGFLVVKPWLASVTWKSYAALTGSWVGGTGNLAAVGQAFEAQGTEMALAVLADTCLLMLWLPVMLSSKKWAGPFARFAGVDAERVHQLDEAAKAQQAIGRPALYYEYLYLLFVAFAATWVADAIKVHLPTREPVLTASVWRILLITTIGVGLSFTPLRRIPASRELGMALIFLFMAQTGATANLSAAAAQAGPFLLGALICLLTHGAFTLLGAKLLHVDIHTAAVASAANVGGVATASCVAAHHKESLMPAAILLALLGYAIGNYAGLLTGFICQRLL